MENAFEKAAVAVTIILLAQLLKWAGVFKADDYKVAAKICINITLPAAIITVFAGFRREPSLYMVVLLGILCNVVVLASVWYATRKEPAEERLVPLLNIPGYQIGTFSLPLIGSLLGPYSVLVTCMFDLGNAVMCAGLSYALVSASVIPGRDRGFSWRSITSKLLSSAPFDVYVLLLLWTSVGFRLPEWLLAAAKPAAGANFFLAMFMIGLMIDIRLNHRQLRALLRLIAAHFGTSLVFALFFWFCTPFSLEIRRTLAIIIFSPISALSPVFTSRCGGDTALSSLACSVSILVSIVCMMAVCAVTA